MAKKDPPRPGGRGRPTAKRPRAGGPSRSRASRPTGNAPVAAPPKPSAGGASWKPKQDAAEAEPVASELRMVPLTDSDGLVEDDAPKGATAFFALPTPRRKAPSQEPSGPPPVAPAAAPPPGLSPGPMGGPPPGMSMGISGPVASGPVAGGPPGFAGAPYGGGPVSLHPADGGQDRARSYRVFAIVGGLMMMVFVAVIITLGLVVLAVTQTEDAAVAATPAIAAAPAPRAPLVDTGIVDPPVQQPKPRPRPRPSGTPSPRPAPAPVAAPAPPPAPVGPATSTVSIPASEPFTGVEVNCPLSGFRERASFVDSKATIANVPIEDCALNFKGGPPARNTIRGGQNKTCTFPDGNASCN